MGASGSGGYRSGPGKSEPTLREGSDDDEGTVLKDI